MLFDRSNWPQHRPWLILFVLVTAGSIVWFGLASHDLAQWPGGSSLPGFAFGVGGGLIIVFEFLLWLRKKVRVWRIGSAQTWLRAHIWLGLLCVPLLILHSGLRLGGTLSTVLMAVLVLVVVSGLWGLILQNLLPKQMLGEIPSETVYAQKDALVHQLVAEADVLVSTTCGTSVIPDARPVNASPTIVGTVRFTALRLPAAAIPESGPLADFYREQVAPFLREGAASESLMGNAREAALLFQNCKALIPPDAHAIVDALERFCHQRRQWDSQARLHFWLHNWLWVHFPLSVALLILMLVHVFVALRFW